MRTRALGGAAVALAVVATVAGCAAPAPAPTVTVTVFATATPTPDPTVTAALPQSTATVFVPVPEVTVTITPNAVPEIPETAYAIDNGAVPGAAGEPTRDGAGTSSPTPWSRATRSSISRSASGSPCSSC